MTPVAYICDDDAAFVTIVKDVFKDHDVTRCFYFTDPLALLQAVRSDTLIFMLDYRMSGINGITVTRRILSLNKHALIVMLSMQEDVSVTAEFYDAGGWKYISKHDQLASIITAATWIKYAQLRIEEMLTLEQDKAATLEWIRKKSSE